MLLALLAIGAFGVAAGGPLLRWIGAGVLLFAAPPVLRPVVEMPRVRDTWRRFGPHIVFGVVFALLCGELLLGRPPATRDHGIHYFQTHLLVHDLLPQGRLNGWSLRLNHGYPYGDSYPVLGYLLMAGLHLVSFGLVSLRASYAYGIAALWLGSAAAVWWCASSIARELHDRTADERNAPWIQWAGCFGAIAWMLDPGAARQGGWNYLMFHGVWPQQLSSALWLVTIPLGLALWRRPTPRNIGLLALTVGAAVMAHPFGMLTCAFTAVGLPLVALVTEGRRGGATGAIRAHVLAYLLGAGLCAGTVVIFLSSADYMGRSPVPWSTWPELAAALVTGEPFRAHRAITGTLAVVGAIMAARRGKATGWLALVSVVGLMLLASQASVTALRLDLLVSAFKNLQFPRYALAVKPVWFALAGVGLGGLVAALAGNEQRPGWLRRARTFPDWARLVACVAMAPLLVGAIEGARDAVPQPVGGIHTLEGTHHGRHEAALHDALQAEIDAVSSQLEPGVRPRVAFLRRGMSGGTYPLFAIADVNANLAMDSHIPSVNFVYRLDARDPAALDALGTTHVIYDRPLPMAEQRLEKRLETVGTFGDYTLARLLPGDEPRQPPLRDGGIHRVDFARTALATERSPNLEIEVPAPPDATPDAMIDREDGDDEWRTRVEIALAPYRKWAAFDGDDQPLEIRPRRLHGRSFVGMTVAAHGRPGEPGIVKLRYVRPPAEIASAWISLVSLLLAGIAVVWAHPVRWRPRLRTEVPWRRAVTAGCVLAGLGLAVGVPLEQARGLETTWGSMLERGARAPGDPEGTAFRFGEDLVMAGRVAVWSEHTDRCDGMLTKDAQAGCSSRAQRPHLSMLYARPYLYRCLSVTVPALGEAQLSVEGLADDERVVGVIERVTHGRGGKSLTFTTSDPDTPQTSLSRPRKLRLTESARLEGARGTVTVDLKNDLDEAQTICIALATAEVVRP